MYDIKLSNIPIINLLNEFHGQRELLSSEDFRDLFVGQNQPIKTPQMIWTSRQGALLTVMLQRAILGVESVLPFAVELMLASVNRINAETLRLTREPHLLGGKTNADRLFNRLPALLDSQHALRRYDESLWRRTKQFYKELRNPLFHGYEIESGASVTGVHEAFQHILAIYDWVDTWYDHSVLGKIGDGGKLNQGDV